MSIHCRHLRFFPFLRRSSRPEQHRRFGSGSSLGVTISMAVKRRGKTLRGRFDPGGGRPREPKLGAVGNAAAVPWIVAAGSGRPLLPDLVSWRRRALTRNHCRQSSGHVVTRHARAVFGGAPAQKYSTVITVPTALPPWKTSRTLCLARVVSWVSPARNGVVHSSGL